MYRYKPTELEQLINWHYKKAGIVTPGDMDIERIAAACKVDLEYYRGPSFAEWDDEPEGNRLIVLDKRLPEEERRAQFFHELAHILRHCGHQNKLPTLFVQLQEIQAAQFQLAASMPSFMLQECGDDHSPKVLAEEFRLPFELVQRRLEQIRSRIMGRELLNRRRRFRATSRTDLSKHHVVQALIELRRIQRLRKEKRQYGIHRETR